jgi:phage-related protein
MRSSLKDLRGMPDGVKVQIGRALGKAQAGNSASYARRMAGNLRDVVEIVADDVTGTYRAMYTTVIGEAVYVLHVFQKKSKHGLSTPLKDLGLIAQRLRAARERALRRPNPAHSKRAAATSSRTWDSPIPPDSSSGLT